MAKNLLIVESPAKAKTIEKYLGEDFRVKASFGHIRDLPKGDKAVDIKNDFLPVYEISEDKVKIVNELRKAVREAQEVWLATDEDREGEAISWHLLEVLHLDWNTTKRIVFHEITKPAIQKAIQTPRKVDMALVNAQQARRVLDRLVGFELSPVLWKKIKPGLSAGRVQSVAVRIIVEREREILNFKVASFFRAVADLQTQTANKATFKAEVSRKWDNQQDAGAFLHDCIGAGYIVQKIETKPVKRTPAPPFITSTLQQEASRKMGLSVQRTMRLAQSLYENGHITYMRTDSVNLSETALAAAEAVIKRDYGAQYHQRRTFKSKSAGAQEAHEAIRPTNFDARQVSSDPTEQRLYELIWKRTVASQMADAQLERTIVDIEIRPAKAGKTLPKLVATGEVIKFDGFLHLYLEGKDVEEDEESDENALLPPMVVGQTLDLLRFTATERFTRAAPRYTEASLVKKLEELGIGRPSTYAPTISTIILRNYVVKENREGVKRNFQVLTLEKDQIKVQTKSENSGVEKNKLFPTDLGMVVTDFLTDKFGDVIDYSFTAKVEEEFDEIARGGLEWGAMLHNFYPAFHQKVLNADATAERSSGERILGHDPVSGKRVSARLARYGPIVQIGEQDDPDKRYASLKPNQRLELITLEEGMELFKLPRELGVFENEVMKANIGRFGPYIQHAGKFYSLPKELDPYKVDELQAVAVIETKRQTDAAKLIKEFPDTNFSLLNGRWGPYLAVGKLSVPLPKNKKDSPETLTFEECQTYYEAFLNDPKNKAKVAAVAKAAAKNEPKPKAEKKTATTEKKATTPRKKKTDAAADSTPKAEKKPKTSEPKKTKPKK